MYKYSFKSTSLSSSHFGNCEVCGKHVSDVFRLVESREFLPGRFTHHKCFTIYGHEKCLLNSQRIHQLFVLKVGDGFWTSSLILPYLKDAVCLNHPNPHHNCDYQSMLDAERHYNENSNLFAEILEYWVSPRKYSLMTPST